MITKKFSLLASTAALLLASHSTSSGIVVLLSDGVAAGTGQLENFLMANFNNVTQIRHGNFANFNAPATQDALNGTGAWTGFGPVDVVILGRTIASAEYITNAAGYNTLDIPVVALSSYAVRQDGPRMGWHASNNSTDKSVAGIEATITGSGAAILGFAAGTYDFITEASGTDSTFNGLGVGSTTGFGGGSILATIGGDTLAAFWDTGAAPGNPTTATVATFPAPRLLFNLDNDNNGDLGNINAAGEQALISAIDYATPLTAVPEPSSVCLLLGGVGLIANRRRRTA
jgi:hypothetical protein